MPEDVTGLKKYVATKTFEAPGIGKWKKGEAKRINPEDFRPYMAARFILPFRVALDEGYFVPQGKESAIEKVVEAVTGVEIDNPPKNSSSSQTEEKSFLGNKLRDAIQKKKVEKAPKKPTKSTSTKKASTSKSTSTKKPSLTADKLAAIKAGGKGR